MEEKEKENEKQVRELLKKEVKVKYPPGSYIMFSAPPRNKGEELTTVSCSWYDKVGGKRPLKHIIDAPPEWQNISVAEADKIAEMFDKSICIGFVYVKPDPNLSVPKPSRKA